MAWELFRRDGEGGLEMIGIAGDLLDAGPVGALPMACEITVDAPATLPEFLAPTESDLDRLTGELGGRIVATSRTSTRLVTLTYLPSDEHAERFTRIALPARAAVSVAPANDPDWTLFDRYRPRDMETQSMADLARMADLHASGDVGGERDVEHTVTEIPAGRAAAFAEAVGRIGFIADARGDGAVDEPIVLRHRADPSDLTADSWTLRLVAERHGGVYRGWSCDIVRAEPKQAGQPKYRQRKWLGRR